MATKRWIHMKGPSNHLLQIDSRGWCLRLIQTLLALVSYCLLLHPLSLSFEYLYSFSISPESMFLIKVYISKVAELQAVKAEGKSKTHYHWLAAGTDHIHNSGIVGRKYRGLYSVLLNMHTVQWVLAVCQIPSNHEPTLMHQNKNNPGAASPQKGFCHRRAINTESKMTTAWLW